MKISVIMVSFNSEKTIKNAVESYLAQDHPHKELLIIDGGSFDSTCSIVKSFESPLIKLISEPDDGIYNAMNKGLVRMTGDAFGFLNSDDCFSNRSSLAHLALSLDKYDIVSGRLHFVKEHDGANPVREWNPERFRSGAYRRGFSLPHPTSYSRRCVYNKVGLFNDSYRSAGDYDWFLRALEIEGCSHGIIDEVLVNMRLGGESTRGIRAISNNSLEMLLVRRERLNVKFIDLAFFWNIWKKVQQIAVTKFKVTE